jgi:hypothetical protein
MQNHLNEQTAAAGAMPIQAEMSAGGDDGGGAVPVCTLDGDGTTLGQTGRLALRSTLRISCGHALFFKAQRGVVGLWWAGEERYVIRERASEERWPSACET